MDKYYNVSSNGFSKGEGNIESAINEVVIVTRGIINGYYKVTRISVTGVGHCYTLNDETLLHLPQFEDRVLGVAKGVKFNVCYEINLVCGSKVFGFVITKEHEETLLFQTIARFDLSLYNSFNQSYQLGEQIVIPFRSIVTFSMIDYQLYR
jgi:hypothetical protein